MNITDKDNFNKFIKLIRPGGLTKFLNNVCVNGVFYFFWIAFLSVSLFYSFACAETKPVGVGAYFPNLTFKEILSKEEQAYLGISRKTSFSFKDIHGTLFLVEVTSTYCLSCLKNVPILNEVYSKIENDPELKGKVKVFSIAVGNNRNEVESFKKEYKILYPIFTDFNFAAHEALGNPRAPYTIFVRRDPWGKGIVVNTHRGVIEAADSVMKDIRDFLQCNPAESTCEFKLKEK